MHVHDAATPIHWRYFLTLDEDLTHLSRFIEFDQENFASFSIECARILLSAASEVDVVAKQICQEYMAGSKAKNINEYREVICSRHPKLPEFQVMIPRYGIKLTPWKKWSDAENPDWWRAYNNVKHERNAHFREASLSNTLNSTASLFMLLLLFHKDLAESGRLSPNPILFRAGHPFQVDTMMWSAEERTFIYKFPTGS